MFIDLFTFTVVFVRLTALAPRPLSSWCVSMLIMAACLILIPTSGGKFMTLLTCQRTTHKPHPPLRALTVGSYVTLPYLASPSQGEAEYSPSWWINCPQISMIVFSSLIYGENCYVSRGNWFARRALITRKSTNQYSAYWFRH